MRYLVLIQARCGSSRLPNKVLMSLNGKTVIETVIERVKRSEQIEEVIVVTSIEKCNLPIIELCARNYIRVFVGSENDVLDRYYQAAKLIRPEYVVRVTGDCPLFDGKLLDEAIEQMETDSDYMGMLSETFADGLDIEIIKFSALKKAWEEAKMQSQREHVTQYIIQNPEKFKLQDFKHQGVNFGEKRWTLDEPEDYQFIESVVKKMNQAGKANFSYKDILDLLEKEPELEDINKKYARNEGLQKSLREDKLAEIN